MDKWRIECPDGIGINTRVSLNGVELRGVLAASLSIAPDNVVTATLVVDNVEVEIGTLKEVETVAASSDGGH